MQIQPTFIIIFFSIALVAVGLFATLVFLLFKFAFKRGKDFSGSQQFRQETMDAYKAKAQKFLDANQVDTDLISNIGNISADAFFSFFQGFTKSVELKFYKISSDRKIPLMVVKAFESLNIQEVSELSSFASVNGEFFIKSGIGLITAGILNGELSFTVNDRYIGKISLQEKKIYDSNNVYLGYYDRQNTYVKGIFKPNLVGEGFVFDYPVYIDNQLAGKVNFNLGKESPIITEFNNGLKEEEKLLLLSLAVFEYVFSLSISPNQNSRIH
jgi:hypothetical protein